MTIEGEIFARSESQIATLETAVAGDYLFVSVIVSGNPVVRFPLPAEADTNEVALRTGNIIDQTGLVDNPCRVETRDEP